MSNWHFSGCKIVPVGENYAFNGLEKMKPAFIETFSDKNVFRAARFLPFQVLIKINFHLFSRFLFLRIFQDHYQCLLTKKWTSVVLSVRVNCE